MLDILKLMRYSMIFLFNTSGLPGRRPAGKSDRGPTPLCASASVAFETVPHGRLLATPPGPCVIGTCHCHSTGRHSRARKLGPQPLCMPVCIARGDFLHVGNFACFPKCHTLRVSQNFPDFFIRSSLPITPMNHAKFHGNRSARFSEIQNTHTHPDRRGNFIYRMHMRVNLFVGCTAVCHRVVDADFTKVAAVDPVIGEAAINQPRLIKVWMSGVDIC